jgi:hypothetical protein
MTIPSKHGDIDMHRETHKIVKPEIMGAVEQAVEQAKRPDADEFSGVHNRQVDVLKELAPANIIKAHWAAAFSVDDWKEFLRAAAWDDVIDVRLGLKQRDDEDGIRGTCVIIGQAVELFSHSEKQVYEQAMDALLRDAVSELLVDASAEVLEAKTKPVSRLLKIAMLARGGPSMETLQNLITNPSVPLALRGEAAIRVQDIDIVNYPDDWWEEDLKKNGKYAYEEAPHFLSTQMGMWTALGDCPDIALRIFEDDSDDALRAMHCEGERFFQMRRDSLILRTSSAIESQKLLWPENTLQGLKKGLSPESLQVFEDAERAASDESYRALIWERIISQVQDFLSSRLASPGCKILSSSNDT